MANLIKLFMVEDDERAFLKFVERFGLEVYPQRIPPDWTPFRASEELYDRLPPECLYLAAAELGPVLVDKVKRGPDKGAWFVDDVRSPVIYFERCTLNEEGELRSGRLWAELDVTPQKGRRDPAPDKFRRLFSEIEEWLKKAYRRSEPKGYLVGPRAARRFKEGLVLREREHRGVTVKPYG